MDLEPWHKVFFRNLADLFRPAARFAFSAVFASRIFLAGCLRHLPPSLEPVRAVGIFSCRVHRGVVGIGAALAATARRCWIVRSFNSSDVIYYAPSEYLPPLDTGGTHRPLPQKGEPEHASQPIISVPAEADNRTQTIVTPSDIKLNHDVPMPNIVAWSQNQAQPAVPLASTAAAANLRIPTLPMTAVAPAPETMPANRQRSAMLSQTVVAPAPDMNAESSRTLRGPQAAVVQPPPSVDASSTAPIGGYQYRTLPNGCARAGTARGRAIRNVRQDASDDLAAVRVRPSWRRRLRFRAMPVRMPSGRMISLGIHPTHGRG